MDIDESGGSVKWEFTEPAGNVTSSPTIVDETVYVGSSGTITKSHGDAALYALDAGVDGSSDGSRVRLGTLGHHDVAAER